MKKVPFGRTGFQVSQLGFGAAPIGYLNTEREKVRRILNLLLDRGVNVIDTAANYRFQRSERSVGAALKELIVRGFARDEIIVCTKGGYLPFDGAPPRDVRQ